LRRALDLVLKDLHVHFRTFAPIRSAAQGTSGGLG
jgi:hypothetical protein